MKSVIKLCYLTDSDSWLIHEKFTFLSPTLNKERLDAKVNLQKWLSGHFLIVKLFVMEFREKTEKAESSGDKELLLTYRCYRRVHFKIGHTA